ncbi:MAG: SDR family NAD(P)-dependent oxidoreductase [Thermoanaerobaculaceae bacterium]
MDLELRGSVAVVTGASRGIGLGIARALAAEGCHLVLVARGQEGLEKAREEIRGFGGDVLLLACDLTRPQAAEDIAEAIRARFSRLDILINNVGGNRRKAFLETTDGDWDELLNWNLLGHVRLTRVLLPIMRGQGSGVVVFVSSIFGREAGGPGLSLYNTTKSAVISLAKILSLEEAPYGIRVLSVAPGSIRFPGGSWDRRAQEDPEGIAKFVAQNLPFGRFGTVEEVASVVAFLVSPKASWVSGVCLPVDGGQSRSLI